MKNSGKQKNITFAVLSTDSVCFRVVDGKLNVLLGLTPETSPFPGRWALIGGMVLPEETAEEASTRLLKDKAGIRKIYLEQMHAFSAVDRDPRGRVVSVAYIGLSNLDPQNLKDASLKTEWFPVSKVPKLAYDHDSILKYALHYLSSNVSGSESIRHLLPKKFTLSEFQNIYEAVAGKKIDKRNFRKKILSSGVVKAVKDTRKAGVMRPARLYVWNKNRRF